MLILEDGSSVEDSNSYLTTSEAIELASNFDIELPTGNLESLLIKGFIKLNSDYETLLSGQRVDLCQGGIFPRRQCFYNLMPVPSNKIMNQVKQAQLLTSYVISLELDIYKTDAINGVKSFEVVGAYKEESHDPATINQSKTEKVKLAHELMRPFFKTFSNAVRF